MEEEFEYKEVIWVGSAKRDLDTFPEEAQQKLGYQLHLVQMGEEPDDFKYFPSVGKGVYEIRIWAADRTYRTFYVAKFEDYVYVLHCFEKKSEKTKQQDIEIAQKRYKELLKILEA